METPTCFCILLSLIPQFEEQFNNIHIFFFSSFLTEARLTSKELPTTAWRRERRLRTGEYHHPPQQQQQQQQHPNHHHHHHHHLASPAGSSASSARGISPCSSPTPVVYGQNSPNSTVTSSATQLHSNAHQISMMMAAAAAAGMRPLCETTGRPSPPPPPPVASHSNMHMARPEPLNEAEIEDAPLDMSVSSSLKQRNSPPPPYREPLPGSQFISTLPRPSVITQAPPKRDTRDNALLANRENDNRSSGKFSLCLCKPFEIVKIFPSPFQNPLMNIFVVLWAMIISLCSTRNPRQAKQQKHHHRSLASNPQLPMPEHHHHR